MRAHPNVAAYPSYTGCSYVPSWMPHPAACRVSASSAPLR